jgi:O-antigen ligase
VLLGAVQVSSGGPYFYPRHNAGEAAGLFANSNHQATLLLATIPFLAAVISEGPKRSARNASAHVGRNMIALVALAVIMIGVALNGSLAGLGLLLPVSLGSLGSLALALSSSKRAPRLLAFLALLLVLLAAVGVGLFSDVGGNDSSIAERRDIYRITLAAIGDTFPVGIGLGAFQPFYRLYEDPALVTNFFINHAHSDPLEWVLETGLPGVLLLAALLFWWAVRAVKLWRADRPDPIALAATVASGAILAHSIVDYPLRDAAIQAVFAMSLAFMAEPRSHSARRSASPVTQAAPRHLTIDDDVSVSG